MADEQMPPPPPLEPAASAQPDPSVPKDARTMAMLCHLLGIFTGFVGPLIIWLIKKEEMPFVDEQGKEAVNFQITAFIAIIVAWLSLFIIIGCVLLPAVCVTVLVFCIIATMKANAGVHYRYPLTIRFIK